MDKSKSDSNLGAQVKKHLEELGIETPMVQTNSTHQAKIDEIESKFTDIMNVMGMDLTDDSLVETPKRVAKMFMNEIFWGLDYDNFPKATTVENKMKYDEMIIEKDVTVMSNCEHHILPILGSATIAYIPGKKVLGLSKIPRIVEFFSRRPQIQERLTQQIGETLKFILGTDDVAVSIDAEHMCVKTRGVEDPCSSTITNYISGVFRDNPHTRQEFFGAVYSDKKK